MEHSSFPQKAYRISKTDFSYDPRLFWLNEMQIEQLNFLMPIPYKLGSQLGAHNAKRLQELWEMQNQAPWTPTCDINTSQQELKEH